MIKKSLLGLGLVLMMAFSFAIPALASPVSEGQSVQVEGVIQSVDTVTGSFTVLAADGTTTTVYTPEGFDLTLLVVGDTIKVEGAVGADRLFAASEITLQDGTEFDVDDVELEDAEDEEETEVEDADETEIEDEDENEVEDDQDEDSGQSESDDGGESGGESVED